MGALGRAGSFSRYGEDRRDVADPFHREIRHMAEDDREVDRLPLVGLLDDQGDTIESFRRKLGDEIPSGSAPRIGDREDAQDEIG